MKEKNNDNIILLNLIFKNANMGIIGIDCVIDKVKDEEILKLIKEQRAEYVEFCNNATSILLAYGAKEETGGFSEIASKFMSEVMCLGADDKKIAKLMMEGNEKGVIEIQEKLNEFQGVDKEIVELAEKLLATTEHNREEFKKYL